MNFKIILALLSVFMPGANSHEARCKEFGELVAPDAPDVERDLNKRNTQPRGFSEYISDELRRFGNGSRPPPKALAIYLLTYLDVSPLLTRIDEAEFDVKLHTVGELHKNGFETTVEGLPAFLAEVVTQLLKNLSQGRNQVLQEELTQRDENDNLIDPVSLSQIYWAEGHLQAGPYLINVRQHIRETIPAAIEAREHPYLRSILEIINEKERRRYTMRDIPNLPPGWHRYVNSQRRCFYAASDLEDVSKDLFPAKGGKSEFERLLADALGGIEDIYYDPTIPTGSERLRRILIHLTELPLTGSLLGSIPGLLTSDMRRGLAHLLVCKGYIPSWSNI